MFKKNILRLNLKFIFLQDFKNKIEAPRVNDIRTLEKQIRSFILYDHRSIVPHPLPHIKNTKIIIFSFRFYLNIFHSTFDIY